MKKLLLVTGSVRRGRAADAVLELVRNELIHYNYEVVVADFKKMPLPLFDNEHTPSSDDFESDDEQVEKWTAMVADANAVVVLAPEYNHSVTPVLKNAIDWVYGPWNDKPIAFIGYGWVGAARAINHLRDIFGSTIAADVIGAEANLRFMKEINVDGTAADNTAVTEQIRKVLDAVQEKITAKTALVK